ncbi:MAG: hypothetical protein IKG11_10125 [Atopobiaceae bacterium]|nr:hypothetical protein [Atopobiaceae bacterium]MDO4404901.1 hypothetical protein [Atopobiaceae bacterium]
MASSAECLAYVLDLLADVPEMMLVGIENRDSVTDLVISMLPELSKPKKRRK